MNEEKRNEVLNALADFIIRVSNPEHVAAIEAEISILPDMAAVYFEYIQRNEENNKLPEGWSL